MFRLIFWILSGLCLIYYVLWGVKISFRTSILYAWPLAAGYFFIAGLFSRFFFYFLIPATLFLACFIPFCFFAARARTPVQKKPEALILLGVRSDRTMPRCLAQGRLELAVSFLKQYPEIPCVISGGTVFRETESEAAFFRRELIGMGISPARLFTEEKSRTTKENFLNAFVLLPNGISHFAVLTSRYHTFRAEKTAKCSSPPASFSLYGAPCGAFFLPHFFLREFFTFLFDGVKGNLSFFQ